MHKLNRYLWAVIGLAFFVWAGGLTGIGQAASTDNLKDSLTTAEQKLGLEVVSLRPTAAGHMLDLRFRVIDPARAVEPLSRKYKAYLTEVESNVTLEVPITKAGPMRQTTLEPKQGRIYFILFGNPGQVVKPGQTVDVTIGPMKLSGIKVQTATAPFMTRPSLDEGAMNKWNELPEKRQTDLLRNFQTCLEHCGGDADCSNNCQTVFKAQLERVYQETRPVAKE